MCTLKTNLIASLTNLLNTYPDMKEEDDSTYIHYRILDAISYIKTNPITIQFRHDDNDEFLELSISEYDISTITMFTPFDERNDYDQWTDIDKKTQAKFTKYL